MTYKKLIPILKFITIFNQYKSVPIHTKILYSALTSCPILTIAEHIEHYLDSLSETKRLEMQALHSLFLKWMPDTK
jgi:hypothetical protein